MDSFIKQELQKTKSVSFYTKSGKLVDKLNLPDEDTLIIKQKTFTQTDTCLFTFEDYLIKPFENFDFHNKFNKGVNIPLKVMQGKIVRQVGKMYYIEVKGFYYKSTYCNHCLKKEDSNPICKDCFRYFNVNDIEEVTWSGYVPIKGCIIENI